MSTNGIELESSIEICGVFCKICSETLGLMRFNSAISIVFVIETSPFAGISLTGLEEVPGSPTPEDLNNFFISLTTG